MTKNELIDNIWKPSNLQRKQVAAIVDSFLNHITAALANGEKVSLVGFGTFSVKDKAEQQILNPRTGEKMIVPARKRPHFSAGKSLKRAVNHK